MTKGTKAFRIIISILLALTMIISAFFAFAVYLYYAKDPYGIYVAGIAVNRDNNEDILGDGTVYYDENNNILTFNNATISNKKDADIFCSGAVVNYGAKIDGEMDAIGGIHTRN